MKRVMVIAAAVLGFSYASKAQTVSFGPTGGFGHSYITNTDGDGKFNPMWNAGLSFIYSTRSNFGVGLDVKYSEEGNKSSFSTGANGIKSISTINSNYVRVPVKAMYFFGDDKSFVRPKVFAGPSFGFLTGGESSFRVNDVIVKGDTKDAIKNFDFGVTGGVGLNFKVAPRTWLNTDVAFYQGLTDITKDNNTTQHNANLGVNAGLLIGLGK